MIQYQRETKVMQRFEMFINGESCGPASGEWFNTENPFTGETWAQIAKGNETDVDRAAQSAHAAFSTGPWSQMSASQRGLLLHRVGDLIARDAKRLAELEVRDNGKLMAEMLGQCQYLPQWYYYFGGLADKIQGAVIPLDKKGYFNYTRNEPLGVVAAITPWNSPLLLATWKIAPALAAGCTVVIKPSEFTSASTIEFAKLFTEADWPLTPEINAVLSRAKLLSPTFGQKYVIRDRRGNPKTDQACRDAWEGAMARAGLSDKPYTIKDIRAKAMTDAKRAGYDLDALQVAGAHTDRSTTQGYIKSREVPLSTVVLHLPHVDAA
jgi:hypothetical protein